jgi:hypothetical protein
MSLSMQDGKADPRTVVTRNDGGVDEGTPSYPAMIRRPSGDARLCPPAGGRVIGGRSPFGAQPSRSAISLVEDRDAHGSPSFVSE